MYTSLYRQSRSNAGLYRYKRLLFGVSSASEVFQYHIAATLAGIEGATNISDNIVVHAPDKTTHDDRLRQVLNRMKAANLTLNWAKCKIGLSELEFFGYLVTERGIGPTEERVQAVVDARRPENVHELRSFLGLVNYSARFFPQYATISEPLRRLTRKDTPFAFDVEQITAFETLKQKLENAVQLAHYDKDAPTMVIADASPVGLGAVLVQRQQDGPVVVSYASRSLTDTERRYSQTEREALGLVWACEKFHPYIYGVRFDLLTDHMPLQAIYSPKSKPCARIERCVLRLQPYEFKVVYHPGKNNIADSLSRLIDVNKAQSNSTNTDEYVRFVTVNATPNAMTTKEVERASAEDAELKQLRQCINTDAWDDSPNKLYTAVSAELCVIGELVLRGTRFVIPRELRSRVLTLAHEGHLGIVGTKQALRCKVWWPGIDKDAERYCRTCHGCQLVAQPDPPEPIRSTTLSVEPWQDLAVDLLGPLPTGHSILVVIDY